MSKKSKRPPGKTSGPPPVKVRGSAMTHPLVLVGAVVLSSPALLDAVQGTVPVPDALIRLIAALLLCALIGNVVGWFLDSVEPPVVEADPDEEPVDPIVVSHPSRPAAPAAPAEPAMLRTDGPPRRRDSTEGRRSTDTPPRRGRR